MIHVDFRKKLLLSLKYPETAAYNIFDKFFFNHRPTPYPRLISCFITEKCNFNCPMCHVKESRLKRLKELEFKDLKRFFLEAEKFKPSFQLVGGEPLIHPEIIKIIKYLTDHRMVKGLVTNGLLLEGKAADLIDSGLDFLGVSLDGADEQTQYQRSYVKNSFAKIIEGIKKTVELRGKRILPNIRIATVITPNNLYSFDKILPLAQELGVDEWSISHYFFYNDEIKKKQILFAKKNGMGDEVWGDNIGGKKEFFNKKERDYLLRKLDTIEKIRRNRNTKVIISMPSTMEVEKYYSGAMPTAGSRCTSPFNQVYLRGNGDLEICQGFLLGNIRESSLLELWNSEKAKHFREIFTRYKTMPACFRCCSLEPKFA